MTNHDAQIVAYLLGELPDGERDALERRFLRDDELREVMRAIEDELIDDYLQGELEPRRHEQFEAEYLSHPERRQRVELARTLSRAWERPPAARVVLFPAIPRIALAAAAVLVIATALWFLAPQLMNRGRIAEAPRQAGGNEQPSQPPVAPQEPAPREPPAVAPPRDLAIAIFTLAPGLTRDAAGAATLAVPPATDVVRLQLPLEPGDEYDTYRAELRGGSDALVWSSGAVRAAGRTGAQSVTLDIERRLLAPGRYELTLTGERNKAAEVVGYYYFRLEMR